MPNFSPDLQVFLLIMVYYKDYLILFFLLFILIHTVHSQNEIDSLDIISQDTLSPVQRSGIFDFVFSRSYIVNSDFREDVPLIASESGTSSIGLSFNRVFNTKIGIHFQPVFKTLRLSFQNDMSRTFPNDPDTNLTSQRYRIYYLATDIGFRYNIKKDEKNRPKTFFEVGVSLGVNVGNSEKKIRLLEDEKIKIKSSTITHINRFYTGSYIKLNYRWLGLYFSYRFSRIFKKNTFYRYDLYDFREYPVFPNFEVGFCLVL